MGNSRLRILMAALLMAAATTVAAADPSSPNDTISPAAEIDSEDAVEAPVDYGFGPGVKFSAIARLGEFARRYWGIGSGAGGSPVPDGPPDAGIRGVFGTPVTWPLVAIHAVLLPDGRVMSYGTDARGHQGAELIYDVWNPALGTGGNAHLVLPNTTATDLFCGAQSVLADTGEVLFTGGSQIIGGGHNYAINKTTIFTPSNDHLSTGHSMRYPRWYASLIALPDASEIVLGGRMNVNPASGLNPSLPATIPELRVGGNWSALTGAASAEAFGSLPRGERWYYPKAAVAPGGGVFVIAQNGTMYALDPAGRGGISQFSEHAPPTQPYLPAVSFAPGKMLYFANDPDGAAMIVDYSGAAPTVTATNPIDQLRMDANGTILADGEVLITGGSLAHNIADGVDELAEIWDPATGLWRPGAREPIARLYHATALLLPDGSVLSAGGGSPGPVTNLNAEIYYPPYLYGIKTDGKPLSRPILSVAATSVLPGDQVAGTIGVGDRIARVTLLRTGSSTHSTNSDQRFLDLPFTQQGRDIMATLPADPTILIPGYYMMFVFNEASVPSISAMIQVRAR